MLLVSRVAMGGFFERLGHRVIHEESCSWYDAGRRFFIAFPHLRPVSPDREELKRVFGATRAVALRFVSTPGAPGRASYALVLEDRAYGLEQLSGNTRSKVRRGLKQFEIRRIDADFARAHGQTANTDTLRRMRFQRDVYEWDRYWDAIAGTDAVEVWGALRGDELSAYLVIARVEEFAEILVSRSRDNALRHYPNNALLFAASRDLLDRPDVDRILFGLESLETVSGVDQFKESMGFLRLPIGQQIVFHPYVAGMARSSLVGHAVRTLARRRPHVELWRKLEGLLIFNGSLADTRGAQETAS